MEHQTLGWWVCLIDPATKRIILKIVGFLVITQARRNEIFFYCQTQTFLQYYCSFFTTTSIQNGYLNILMLGLGFAKTWYPLWFNEQISKIYIQYQGGYNSAITYNYYFLIILWDQDVPNQTHITSKPSTFETFHNCPALNFWKIKFVKSTWTNLTFCLFQTLFISPV